MTHWPALLDHISQTNNLKTLSILTDQRTGKQFPHYADDQDFMDKLSPTINGKKYQLPLPQHNPYHRMIQRMTHRNNRFLYRRKCDLSGKTIITTYSPEKPYTVYAQEIRHGDKRDPLDYKQDFNPSQLFFTQFQELKNKVPRLAIYIDHSSSNSDYANGWIACKNCYLSDTCSFSENLRYCSWALKCEDCMDSYQIEDARNCYRAISCQNVDTLQYCLEVHNSNHCYYSAQLLNCHHCFGCHNLNNASYQIYNQQYSKEEFQAFMKKQNLSSYLVRQQHYENRRNNVLPQTTFPSSNQINAENCLGDGFINCKDCFWSFKAKDAKNMRYCSDAVAKDTSDCLDLTYTRGTKLYHGFSVIGHAIYQQAI